jgi:hypothetical protein
MLVETLHPKPVHADFRQFGAEIPFSGRKNLHVSGLNGRLAWKRVGKAENFAPRHFLTPGFPEAGRCLAPRGSMQRSAIFLPMIAENYFVDRYGSAKKICRNFAVCVFSSQPQATRLSYAKDDIKSGDAQSKRSLCDCLWLPASLIHITPLQR